MNTEKYAHASCPRCGGKPSEFQIAGQRMRWTCHHCGAGGDIVGPQAEAPKPAGPKPYAKGLGRG